ncbi:hypothetical protein C8Q77DRAFT_1231983 [Trametes polyzona]|nr:hypothetical protein C8Q77DRAFT_1231983 [Trametes polyzona]
MADAKRRQPNPAYNGRNGFTERAMRKMTGAAPPAKCNLHLVAANPKDAPPENLRELHDAIQRRQFVEDIMQLRGTFFPGLEAITQANGTPDTPATLKDRIDEMQKRHVQEVRTMYQWQAQDYYDEMLDQARSRGEVKDPAIDSCYRAFRTKACMADTFDDNLDRLNYAHMNSILPIIKDRNVRRLREEHEQRRRDMQFPTSIDEFHAIRNRDVQLRVARFLVANDSVRERMMDEFKWAWRQVVPLLGEYNKIESFQTEVQTMLRDVEAHDPRKARRPPQPTVTAS